MLDVSEQRVLVVSMLARGLSKHTPVKPCTVLESSTLEQPMIELIPLWSQQHYYS